MKILTYWKMTIVLTLLLTSSLACGLLQSVVSQPPAAPVEKTAAPAQPTQVVPTQAVQIAPTQPPVVKPTLQGMQDTPTTAPAAGQKPNAYYEGISFYYDPPLAKGVTAQTIEASAPASDNLPFFAVQPKQFQFDFQGYMVEPTSKPQILVLPIQEYEKQMSGGGVPNPVTKELDNFKKLLADHPVDSSGALPFLPIWDAGQEMHAHLEYIKFQNGSGIRYLTEYGQDVAPVSNKLLFYTFQGLTSDGLYYISAILPVNHPSLDGDPGEALKEKDYGKFMADYPGYVVGAQKQLNAQKDDTFKPTLIMLDAMIASLKIAK